MSIIESFFYENNKFCVIVNQKDDDIWFHAKTVAKILKYSNTRKAIHDHVDDEDKSTYGEIRSRSNDSLPHKNSHTIYINESGLYSLIFRSKMEEAKKFKRWIIKDVLPSIRKTGKYNSICSKPFKMLAFNIQTEYDLHKKVVNFIKNHYPTALFSVSLGENQITSDMRLKSYHKGYQKGSPDLIIQNLHRTYSGLAIEFKNPHGNGVLSDKQYLMLQAYINNNFKILVSNDYDLILKEIIHYFDGVRIQCLYCSKKFKSLQTRSNHSKYIHNKHI